MTPSAFAIAPFPLFLVQFCVILLVTYLCGRLVELIRQPRVIGEIVGGILLGPLALGYLFPSVFAAIFPAAHLRPLEHVSNIGLVLFLFLTGSELDILALRKNHGAALAITAGSIGVPFALGVAISPMLRQRFSMGHVSPVGFVLFIGIAMSITALPLMARIIQERNQEANPARLIPSSVGTMSIVCAAASDLVAWSLLAVAVTLVRSHTAGHTLAMTVGKLVTLLLYILFMLLVVRPIIKRLLVFARRQPRIWLWLPCVVLLTFLSARVTELLGVQGFFGAFLAGICVPVTMRRGVALDAAFSRTLRPIVRFTLPFFFVMTGLRMQTGMFNHGSFRWFVPILACAAIGKVCGGLAPAKIAGMRWKPAAQIGILMNTRGLVELVVINVGLKEGVLSPLLFTFFVIMALVTTAMTVPLLDITDFITRHRYPKVPQASPNTLS